MKLSTKFHSAPAYSVVAAICTILALGHAAPALAGGMVGPDITVQFGDLAIDTTQGAMQLLQRIDAAAANVCAPLNHGDIASRANRDRCREKLVAEGVAKVNQPMLFAAYKDARHMAPRIARVTTATGAK
jgi:UrcA family protein